MNALRILTLTTMDVFKPVNLKSKAYRTAIGQKGDIGIDRYIYGMQSEGIANLHGSFMKQAIPLSGTGIKGPTKPIAKGVKRRAELSKHTTNTPKNKKIKRAKKWQGL